MKKEDDLFQKNGRYCITVHFGEEQLSRYFINAETYGKAIQKIVDDMIEDYPEGFDFHNEIKFVRELFDEL